MPAGNHASRSRLSPAVIALVVGVVIVAGAVAFALVKGGGSGGSRNKGHSISTDTPDFSFGLNKVSVVETVPGAKTSKSQADAIAQSVAAELVNFYKTAYLDPNNWSSGNYDPVWAYFDKTTVADAKKNAGSLTLGDGSAYQTVTPKPSTTSVKILMGAGGKPETVAAQVTFGVLATESSGTQTTVASMGQYFLKPVGKDWVIFAFKIQQSSQAGDQLVGSPPPPSPSPKKNKPSPVSSPS